MVYRKFIYELVLIIHPAPGADGWLDSVQIGVQNAAAHYSDIRFRGVDEGSSIRLHAGKGVNLQYK